MKNIEYNAGEIVELAIRRQEFSISELSRCLHVNRRTLYNWFTKKDLHPELILQIGKVINYNFYPDFEIGFFGLCHEEEVKSNARHTQKIPEDLVFYWMGKYINLLEEYKGLLRKRNSQKADSYTVAGE